MKLFASICFSLVICQFGRTSVLPGQIDKEQLEDAARYNSGSEPVLPTPSNSSVLTTCSGVLNATSGGIAYKAFEPIAANERCVWTIRGGRARGFSLNVLNVGVSDSSDRHLIATCLQHTAQASHNLLNQIGPVSGVSGCNLLVITFASGNDVGNSTGFVLEYAVTIPGSLSRSSLDYIVDAGAPAIIRHPVSAAEYEDYELNTFVIFPALGGYTNILYFRGTLEDTTCFDTLAVYRFNANAVDPIKWQYEGRICGNIESNFIGNGDLILLTFDSDSSRVGTGFQLAIGSGSESQCHLSN